MLSELQTRPECQQAVQTLHLADVVNGMKQANQAFEQLSVQRLEENMRSGGVSNRELMRQTTDAYHQLLKHLEAHATLSPSPEYTLLIDHLSENTEHFNEVVERRKSAPASELISASYTEEVE